MGQMITADTDIARVKRRLGVGKDEKLHCSARREAYLQKFARIMSEDPFLRLSLISQGAYVDLESEDHPHIRIPTNEQEQPVTNYREDVWFLMVQETLTLHELGHVLYTDWDSFATRRDSVEQAWQPAYKRLWNAIEDGREERQLRLEFSKKIARAMETVNANMLEQAEFGEKRQMQDRTIHVYTMLDALTVALLTMAVYPRIKPDESVDEFVERCPDIPLADVLDSSNNDVGLATQPDEQRFKDFLPEIKAFVHDHLTTADGEKANALYHDWWKDAKKLMESSDVSGRRQQQDRGESNPMEGKPDDSDGQGGQQREAKMLESPQEELGDEEGGGAAGEDGEESEDQAAGSGGEGDEEDGEEENGEGEGDDGDGEEQEGDNDGDGGEDGEGEDGESGGGDMDTDDDLEEAFKEEVASEARALEGGDEKMDEIEQFAKIIKGAGPGENFKEIILPEEEDHEYKGEIHDEAKAIAKRLKRPLASRLQREKRARTKRNQRFGQFDSRRMMAVERGDTRAFTRTVKGNEKDYNCMILLDRSSSMGHGSGSPMGYAEKAVGGFAEALEDKRVGVDTAIVDFYASRARLAKAYGVPVDAEKSTLFNGTSSGGTPMARTLALARERINEGSNTHPFMIIVTDGQPNNLNDYQEELEKCNFPVLGVYLAPHISRDDEMYENLQEHLSLFHAGKIVTQEDNLAQVLLNLANEVMF